MPKYYLYVIGQDDNKLIGTAQSLTKVGDDFPIPVDANINSLARGDLLLLTVNSNTVTLPGVVVRAEARRDGVKSRPFTVQRVLPKRLPGITDLRQLLLKYEPEIGFLKRNDLMPLRDSAATALLLIMQNGEEVPTNLAPINATVTQTQTGVTAAQPIATPTQKTGQSSKGSRNHLESDLLTHVQQSVRARGYYFSDETIANYHISLKTRPFVILAGLSGTGKSKLTQLYAEALGCIAGQNYMRIAVRPNWTDDRYLLGYYNAVAGCWVSEPTLDFLLNAESHADHLHFMCLDEMNLAKVEHYFSQFLSAFEEELPEQRIISLYSQRLGVNAKQTEETAPQNTPHRVCLTRNLFFVGTINVDETTQHLSDKVIDRANTIEFYDVDFGKVPTRSMPPAPLEMRTDDFHQMVVHTPDERYRSRIGEINDLLKPMRQSIGYRVMREVELYLANSRDLLKIEDAFDIQVRQRILPRVRGNRLIQKPLETLLQYCEAQQLTRSTQKLAEMKERLDQDGITSFFQ